MLEGTTLWIRLAAATMFFGVAAGAFGAHGLKNVLSEPMKAVFETGVRYHLVHGLALFVVAWIGTRTPSALVTVAGSCFVAGILLFSGSLYALSLSGIKGLGAITPAGGAAFLVGWVCLLVARLH
jgi:uncharacterized membrane protein YgdD (TMEM256/DUF423 family)